MSKGTPSMSGGYKTHMRCRRCGNISYNKKRKVCASCGFGRSTKRYSYRWRRKK
ncbi:MAG: 50S ribosomal protein L37e [Methermicoccaceae archaeon]